ncbi:MAG: hypothetical protein N3E45_00315 [Oscillatoriaceae bacterium SKW80]|nr:hypothetical protein [Oscillatoriaceae bacterium SKYG93]MCX8119272.1 hypothetical protein [Oscillatoriaceae bacterium SKW80]MDW8454739.1 hypothetical protein [Oscillatoriaceae cyanobacterium SKYGB_i_bin93]HIK28480.1 hypothetical protein [Oscillatoriaceae cyanobacterium M7585_C2015_266]
MFDLNALLNFSHAYCIAICAFLVPANLGATLGTLILTALRRPQVEVNRAVVFALALAVIMILHVLSWFVVGVVMAPTYILLSLAAFCIAINFWALAPRTIIRLLRGS